MIRDGVLARISFSLDSQYCIGIVYQFVVGMRAAIVKTWTHGKFYTRPCPGGTERQKFVVSWNMKTM